MTGHFPSRYNIDENNFLVSYPELKPSQSYNRSHPYSADALAP
jgi:hypothetical protein